MLRDLLIEKAGLRWTDRIVLYDIDGLLSHCASFDDGSYFLKWISSDEELRYIFECDYRNSGESGVLVLSNLSINIPYDIARCFSVIRLGIDEIFPELDTTTLRSASNIDFDYLSVAVEHLKGHRLNSEQTKDFYLNKMFNQETVDLYSTSVKKMLDESVDSCRKYRDWMPIIDLLSKLMLLKDKGFEVDAFQIMYATVDTAFRTWIAQKYATLASSADVSQPVMLHHIPDYIRRTSQKPAIIVIDGMSFVDWQLIKEHFTDSSWKFTTTAVFSFLPSVTSIARQSLFSGAIPAQNKNPFSLADEERQWKSYWKEHGLREDEIFFDKSETPDIPYQSKVAGIVVNFIDTLMHKQLQGARGMAVDIKEWLKMGSLQGLIEKLMKMGFNVFITSDHGHSEATGKGRFSKPGLLTESASRRAVIYKDFAGAEELNKFSVNEYTGTYMLNNYRYFLFENGECIGDYGNKYITHGGESIEELLVPFIRIGEIQNG